jgi:hypothetical protein
MKNLKPLLQSSLLLLLVSAISHAVDMQGGIYEMTKDAVGVSGSPYMSSVDYSLAFAIGEPIAGDTSSQATYLIVSGYFGGQFGNAQNFTVLSSLVGQPGTKTFFQDQLQVGVPYDAPVQISFTDVFQLPTLAGSIQVIAAADHLGNSSGISVPVTLTPDTSNQIVTIQPQTAWTGNTLYDIQISPKLLNLDGAPLDGTYNLYFLTRLNQQEDNVVLNPLTAPGLPAAVGTGPIEPMSIHLSAESLSAPYTVLSSRNPLSAPLTVDPRIIQTANSKAQAAGGAYRVPLALQEINAYDSNGNLMGPLSVPAELTINYGGGFSAPGAGGALIRPQTLSLYVLDQTHSLWVKIPASQNSEALNTVTAPVTQLSVFALIGNADGSAADTFVFPVPWRPHGPNAGTGVGQTGTEASGMTFGNLPSECTIKIYTVTGDLVRQIQHSDTGAAIQGEEPWDGKTTHGEIAASGVYLWRVESSVDSKNGKLMIIR